MAYQRNIRGLPDDSRFMRVNGAEEFGIAIMDAPTDHYRLVLECPDYKNPRNANEAEAVSAICAMAKLRTPDNCYIMLGGQVPGCPLRWVYSKSPWSEKKGECRRYAEDRDRHYGLLAAGPGAQPPAGAMSGAFAHAIDTWIAQNVSRIPVSGALVPMRDADAIQQDLDQANLQIQTLNQQIQTLQAAQPVQIQQLRTRVDAEVARREAVEQQLATIQQQRDDARQQLVTMRDDTVNRIMESPRVARAPERERDAFRRDLEVAFNRAANPDEGDGDDDGDGDSDAGNHDLDLDRHDSDDEEFDDIEHVGV